MLLNLLLPALRLAACGAATRAALARLGATLALLFIALILALAGLGFALLAAYSYLETLVPQPAAAAIVAAVTLANTAVITAVALRRPRRPRAPPAGAADIGAQMQAIAGRLNDWARHNPWEAAAAAFAVGIAIGARR
jgi:hypothetical protein